MNMKKNPRSSDGLPLVGLTQPRRQFGKIAVSIDRLGAVVIMERGVAVATMRRMQSK